ncbi:ComF family protein [Nocardia sp. 348MFTsu5.1]|uniref:ComF family protein n=1 Tax=Nocardia sp. 348MFTsu5.1 TaxID=1172185 RepID=UPI0003727472|nr:ComF family protein [Nocardia sp. 348MFTsu5.1]
MVERVWPALVDLVVPLQCGGCARPGTRWCRTCAREIADAPIEVRTRVALPVPAYALGRYSGVRRQAILELKERGRSDLSVPLGRAVATALLALDRWSELPAAERLLLIPAPTRRMSARRRGGDPVTAIAGSAARALGGRVEVTPLLVTSMWARDSAHLSAGERGDNLTGAIRIRRSVRSRFSAVCGLDAAVVLLDDVLTTGATVAESVSVLANAGVEVHLVLVIAAA